MKLTSIKPEKEREAMRNSIRCCISCILPCGALDVIRIVHCNGRVEEISGTIKASEIMKAYPKHVLKKPSSSSSQDGSVVPKIVVVPPDADLQRGKIYFLMPLPSPPPEKSNHRHVKNGRKKRKEQNNNNNNNNNNSTAASTTTNNNNNVGNSGLVVSSDQYLTEILSEKLSCQRDRRRGRVAVWRPHLESISESPNHL